MTSLDDSENKNHYWYILNVISGQENKIANEINLSIISGKFGSNVSSVLVPAKKVTKIKKGKKAQDNQKIFPGYIFIKANIKSEAYNIINSIPKVIGFLGSKNNPEIVPDQKISEILSIIDDNSNITKNSHFEIGETLKVTDGPFESFSGVVEEFDSDKQKVKISILIFGRSTSVELNIDQVEKI